MPDINPEALDFRVASGLFAGLREWNENTPETLRLFTRHQGRLVPNIPEEAHDQRCPAPVFEENGFFTAIFYPNPEVRAQAGASKTPQKHPTGTPQVVRQFGTKLALSRDQVEIIDKCLHDSQIGELMVLAGRTNRTKFRDQVLKPLIAAGFIEMTFPDKPRSSKQQYRTTAAGRAVLANTEKETQS